MTLAALTCQGLAFEKIALIDTFDFATVCDIEKRSGCDFMLEHVERTGANVMAWRQQTGGRPRYRSEQERHPLAELPFSKLRIPESRPGYGWLNLDRGEEDLLAYPYRITAAHGELPAVHLTVEENHYYSFTFSTWVLEHPEYWCVMGNGVPWPGHAAFSFDEEIVHRVKLLERSWTAGRSSSTSARNARAGTVRASSTRSRASRAGARPTAASRRRTGRIRAG